MTRYYYFINSPEDDLKQKIIYNVACGENRRDEKFLQSLQFVTKNSNNYFFSPRSCESTEFVRRLMDEYSCVLTNATIRDIWVKVKDCHPRNVINLSNNYKPLSENRI